VVEELVELAQGRPAAVELAAAVSRRSSRTSQGAVSLIPTAATAPTGREAQVSAVVVAVVVAA
jgi:hypothetical protein